MARVPGYDRRMKLMRLLQCCRDASTPYRPTSLVPNDISIKSLFLTIRRASGVLSQFNILILSQPDSYDNSTSTKLYFLMTLVLTREHIESDNIRP